MPDDTKAEIRVRAATLADTVNVAKFCLKTGAWSARSGTTNETRVYQFVFSLISRGLVAIADLSGNVVGSIGVLAIQPTHTEEWSIFVDWLKVQSHLKDSGVATSLLRFALRMAKKGNSNLLLHLSTPDLEQIGAEELRALGFAPTFPMWLRKADANDSTRAGEPAAGRPSEPTAGAVDEPGLPPDDADGEPDGEPAEAEPAEPVPDVAEPVVPTTSRFRRADGPTDAQVRAEQLRARRQRRQAAPT